MSSLGADQFVMGILLSICLHILYLKLLKILDETVYGRISAENSRANSILVGISRMDITTTSCET
jgi:hypothetical protein